MRRRAANHCGNTLIEVVVATTLVGVVLVAALETLGGAARTHQASSSAAEAWALAQRISAEQMVKPYDNLQSISSSPLPGYLGWSVEVIVDYRESTPSGLTIEESLSDQGLKRLCVRVTDAKGAVTELETLRSRYGAGMHPTPLGLPQVGGITASLSVAGAPQQLFGDQPLNEAPTP